MNKPDMYGVTITCDVNNNIQEVSWNPFVNSSLVTSHIVALTTSRLAQADLPTPDKSRATITVFSVSGDDKNRKSFLNKNCRSEFLISGRENIYLAATANQTTTNSPGVVTRLVYEAIQIAIPILPLIKGTALAATIIGDVAKTEDPLKKMFMELDKGRTYTKSDDLFIGDNVITTPYSKVNVRISKIRSILDPSNGAFLKIFEDATDTAGPSLGLSGAPDPTAKCKDFATGLRGRNFAPADIAYALVSVSQAASLEKVPTLDCLGSKYALLGLNSSMDPAWTRYSDGPNFSKADAKSRFATAGGGAIPVQPKFSSWSKRLNVTVKELGAYLQTKGAQSSTVAGYYTTPVHLHNKTTFYSDSLGDSDPALAVVLEGLVTKNFRRAGCLTSDTESLAAFSLFRSTVDGQKQFKSSDSIIMRVWYNENQSIGWIELDYDAEVLEKALNGKLTRICGEDLEVLPLPKKPD